MTAASSTESEFVNLSKVMQITALPLQGGIEQLVGAGEQHSGIVEGGGRAHRNPLAEWGSVCENRMKIAKRVPWARGESS